MSLPARPEPPPYCCPGHGRRPPAMAFPTHEPHRGESGATVTDPLVSVLVPTYNGERFLRSALRSALEQSYRNLEIVVVDDGSTDRTPDILAATATADDRVRVVRRERNAGAYDNPRLIF